MSIHINSQPNKDHNTQGKAFVNFVETNQTKYDFWLKFYSENSILGCCQGMLKTRLTNKNNKTKGKITKTNKNNQDIDSY